MSLHIGNLSAGIHIDDLQRVFRRFGRCTIRVMDKYGFVVYDYPASAEKALKTLRGTRICGQAITVSWSKQQPRSLQRIPPREKLNEQPHRRYPVKEYANQRLGSYDLRKNEMNSHKADSELRTGSSDLIYESISYLPGDSKRYVGGKNYNSLNDHGTGASRKTRVNVSRWDEQTVDQLNENYLENNLDFDRYEPHNSDSKKELDEHTELSPLVDSSSVKKFQDRRGHFDNEKSEKRCYFCGDAGHERSNCPLEPKRHMSGSQGRLHPNVDTVPLGSQDSDREPSTSKGHQRLLRHRDSSTRVISPRGRGKELKDKKRNRRDHESQDKSRFERARDPSSSPIHSDYSSSRSQSPSRSLRLFSQPSSQFKLKSVPSKKVPLRSSRESSPSRHSGYETFKSRSKAGSMSPISSVSPKEVNQSVSPSPDKVQVDFNVSLANDVDVHPSTVLFDEKTQLRSTGAIRSNGDDRIVNNLPLHSLKGMGDAQSEQRVGATEANISVKSNASSSVRMSIEEVHMVLKHYGLQHPEEHEKYLPVDVYFGSARMWPWEIIYYRRLKKGPISAENSSRRIAQNAEFGIVDRHVRGSSGWGELHENNP